MATAKSRPLNVWNIGLPRTGTTSTTDALKKFQLRCVPVVAQWIAQDISRWGGFERTLPGGTPLICTVRECKSWVVSVERYFRKRASVELLVQIYAEHQEWVNNLDRPVGFFQVKDGYAGLFRALSVAHEGVQMPHMNESKVAKHK